MNIFNNLLKTGNKTANINGNKNSSGDEIANVNFYDDIAHLLQNARKENLLRLTNYTIPDDRETGGRATAYGRT